MNKDEITLGGVTSEDGTIVATGRQGITTYALISWRIALGLEIKSGGRMVMSRATNARTIIPQLVYLGITDVDLTRLTMKRKLKAYNDLNGFLVSKGGVDRPLPV